MLRGDELLARLGASEFAIVAVRTDRTAAVFIAERVLGKLRKPIKIGNHVLGVSIGISLSSNDVSVSSSDQEPDVQQTKSAIVA